MSKIESIIIINAGSSSLKFKLFNKDDLKDFSYGQITGIGTEKIKLVVKNSHDSSVIKEEILDNKISRDEILVYLLELLLNTFPNIKIVSAGHRVVHGADKFINPTIITKDIVEYLRSIEYLSPIHLPHNIRPMEVLMQKFPEVKQVGCFDTAFHATNPTFTKYYAIPRELIEEGKIMRYGFHGISYEYIAMKLQQIDSKLHKGKVVVCHLGAGASMCAMIEGKSYTTTMGFTPLEGLVMGSRTGNIDPGVLLYLMNEKNYSSKDLEDLLYYKSGVLGLSGISSDFYTLEQSSDPKAMEAINIYRYNLVKNIGSLMAVMGGLDGLIFTAGVGENDSQSRKFLAEAFAFLGIEIDEAANKANQEVFSTSKSKVKMMVIPTNEELMIAKSTAKLI